MRFSAPRGPSSRRFFIFVRPVIVPFLPLRAARRRALVSRRPLVQRLRPRASSSVARNLRLAGGSGPVQSGLHARMRGLLRGHAAFTRMRSNSSGDTVFTRGHADAIRLQACGLHARTTLGMRSPTPRAVLTCAAFPWRWLRTSSRAVLRVELPLPVSTPATCLPRIGVLSCGDIPATSLLFTAIV